MADQKVALVCGGGSGMGAATAKLLASRGYGVAILSPSGKGEALAKTLGGLGVTGSNESEEDLRGLVEAAMARWGRIDALVNSAGHGPRGPIGDLTDADWRRGLDVYFLSAVRPARRVAPIMAAQGGGAIVNISSFAAFEPEAAFPTSAVFRAGLASFAKLFSDQYAKSNVRMNNILPGFIDSFPEKAEIRARVPLGRYGKVSEIAEVAAFLVSDGAAYVTGQNWRVDGGLTRAV